MPKLHSLNSNSYRVLTNFEESSEKECIKMDKKNEKIYLQLLSQANSAEKKLRNSVLSFNLEIPPPPRPCNRDRYNLWKKRNVEKPVILQSEAVLFLNENGYELNSDYEAYQAIDLAKEIKREKGIEDTSNDDSTKLFDNIYSLNDNNFLRKRSSFKMNTLQRRQAAQEAHEKQTKSMFDNSNELNVFQQKPTAPPEPSFVSNNLFGKPGGPPFSRNFVFPEKGLNSFTLGSNL